MMVLTVIACSKKYSYREVTTTEWQYTDDPQVHQAQHIKTETFRADSDSSAYLKAWHMYSIAVEIAKLDKKPIEKIRVDFQLFDPDGKEIRNTMFENKSAWEEKITKDVRAKISTMAK